MGLFGSIVKVQNWTSANVLRVDIFADNLENLLRYMVFSNSYGRDADSFNNEACHKNGSRLCSVLDHFRVISAHIIMH